MIQVVWEFRIKEGKRNEFEAYYSDNGKWAELFRINPSYRGTILTRDKDHANRYLVLDTWDDLDSYQTFKEQYAEDYKALDKKCEELTVEENCLGIFEIL
jgi:quinol monooxygenase YgiN